MYDCFHAHTGLPPSDNPWSFNSDGTIRSNDWNTCMNIDGGGCDDQIDNIHFACYDPNTGGIPANNVWKWIPVSKALPEIVLAGGVQQEQAI
eukprot:6173828-Prymnesium_polylepis.2